MSNYYVSNGPLLVSYCESYIWLEPINNNIVWFSDVPGVGTHKWMPPKMIKTKPSGQSTHAHASGRIVKDLGLNGENLNVGHER